jgi:hypothetical protein
LFSSAAPAARIYANRKPQQTTRYVGGANGASDTVATIQAQFAKRPGGQNRAHGLEEVSTADTVEISL